MTKRNAVSSDQLIKNHNSIHHESKKLISYDTKYLVTLGKKQSLRSIEFIYNDLYKVLLKCYKLLPCEENYQIIRQNLLLF